MIYIIPSQTLFQQRTPRDMIGRVVGIGLGGVAMQYILDGIRAAFAAA